MAFLSRSPGGNHNEANGETRDENFKSAFLLIGALFFCFAPVRVLAQNQRARVQAASPLDGFVLIKPGTFLMGSPESANLSFSNEKPQREVTITRPFYLGARELTQAEWVAVMGQNPSRFTGRGNPARFKGRGYPVENVSWDEVQEFLQKLNKREKTTRYRLPTEAEWDYAARAGSQTEYLLGEDERNLDDYAWHENNSGGGTHPVGLKDPNPWGLFDMYGNVFEWVSDFYGDYSETDLTDPQGPSEGYGRVYRGCSWDSSVPRCRSAERSWEYPERRKATLGLRLAFTAEN
ncbi:MAG: formylglycine-generating enzyme family protein [Deltaproteobacteria bacterium]|nr:formylglycine-generating enzyme family protein [Deltaproteobacteria bacterium]